MQWFLRRHLVNALLFITLTLLVVLSFFSFYQLRKLNNVNTWIVHSYKVINAANTTLMHLNYATSNMRGYIVTTNINLLKDFSQTIQLINVNLDELQTLTRDNPEQTQRVLKLKELVQSRIFWLKYHFPFIYIKSSAEKKRYYYGQTLTDKIQKLSEELIAAEHKLLVMRTNISYDKNNLTTLAIFFANIFSLALIFFSFRLLNRHLDYRIDTESKLRHSERSLFKIAYFDALTGLNNRAFLIKKIEETLKDERYENSAALLLIDIDNFKVVNDSLGYSTGDMVLKFFGERLAAIVRVTDTVVRLDNDQFVIFIPGSEPLNDLMIIAEKILRSCTHLFPVNDHEIHLTASIGISVAPMDGIDAPTLLKNAFIAMYSAKELGKNNFQFCTQEMVVEVENKASLNFHLHKAVTNNEFILLYQPKISLNNGRLTGIEALIRWNKPNEGLIYPLSFISLAESNGLIVPIGEWMLRTVCEQGVRWKKLGLPSIGIAINISPLQFILSNIVDSIAKILEETGFDPTCLEIEITENIWLRNSFNNLSALRELKRMGLKITIDDFGTGYSSLSYLSSFPIDKLKIDQSFVKQIANSDTKSLINAMIIMAHSLNIQVIAEGVENSVQAEQLKQFNCDEAQGFYYSAPITADAFEKYFKEWHRE